jgi:sec-independent protein translocase protein TatC
MPQEQATMGFWDQIGEFTKRMKIVLVVFVVTLFVMLILPANSDFFAMTNNYQPLVKIFLDYIRVTNLPPFVKLFVTSASDGITLYFMAAVVFAVAVTMPVFAYQLYKFINPALYPHERKAIFPFVGAVISLFIAGAFFGFFFLFPSFIQGLIPFITMVGAEPWMPVMDFYNMLFFTIIISGIIFTMPAFFVILVKFNIIGTRTFSKKRKYVYAGLVIAALLVSPGATPLGDLYLFISLALLFEVSLAVAKRFERKPDVGTPGNITVFGKIFSSANPTCKYCHKETDGTSKFCSNCKRMID